MSGNTTEWGDQVAVSTVDLSAINQDTGAPVVSVPALQGEAQTPVMVPGPALVNAAAGAAALLVTPPVRVQTAAMRFANRSNSAFI